MKSKNQMRLKRKLAIRYKVIGTSDRPRVTVHRTNTRLSVQVVDDGKSVTLFSKSVNGKNIASAKALGSLVVQELLSRHITAVVYDRSGFRYHGAVQAVADAIREGGVTV